MPAACTGVYGFKPSAGRIPYSKQTDTGATGFHSVLGCAGPLCHDLGDVELFMKSVIDAKPWRCDSKALAVPWRSLPVLGRNLTVGVLAEDPKYPLHPPVRRALSTAAQKLAKAGHKIVELAHDSSPSISVSNDLMFKYYGCDPDQTVLRIIRDAGEPMVQSLVKMNTLGSLGDSKSTDIRDLAAMNRLRANIIDTWMKVFVKNDLDVILAPPAQSTAVEHDHWNWIPYTTSFNLVDVSETKRPSKMVSQD